MQSSLPASTPRSPPLGQAWMFASSVCAATWTSNALPPAPPPAKESSKSPPVASSRSRCLQPWRRALWPVRPRSRRTGWLGHPDRARTSPAWRRAPTRWSWRSHRRCLARRSRRAVRTLRSAADSACRFMVGVRAQSAVQRGITAQKRTAERSRSRFRGSVVARRSGWKALGCILKPMTRGVGPLHLGIILWGEHQR